MSSFVGAGFDFGNKNIVIGAPKGGSIDVILNEASNRLTPTIVSYTSSRRYFGVHAQSNQLQNINDTIFHLKKLVCLKYDDPEREYISSIVPFKLASLPDGFTGIQVKYSDNEEKIIRPEQCIAYLIQSMMPLIQKFNQHINSIVISVSPWWGEIHRRAILDACRIASVDCIGLINSTAAAALAYCINHRQKLPADNQPLANVVFIDFGDSTLDVVVAKMTQQSIFITSRECDEHLGGSQFTDKLVLYLISRIKSLLNIPDDDNFKSLLGKNPERGLIKFRKCAEDLKKKLSINPVVQFETHSFMPEHELCFNVTRDAFESQIGDLISRIKYPVEKAISSAQISNNDIYSIELLGGTSRIPLVKKTISDAIRTEQELSQSLNLDECFAIGAGYMAAILSPSIIMSKYTVTDIFDDRSTIKASWEDSEGKKTCDAFNGQSPVPSKSRLPLMITKSTVVKLYNNQINIAEVSVELEEPEVLENPIKVSLRLRLNQSSMIEISEAVYFDPTNHEQQIIKQAKINVNYLLGLKPSELESFIQEECQLDQRDMQETKIDETKNELESLIFHAESGLTRDYPECYDPAIIDDVKHKINAIHEWFTTHEFERLPITDYQSRLQEIRSLTDAASSRHKLFKKILDMENKLISKGNEMLNKLQEAESKTKDEKVTQILGQFKSFMDKLKVDIERVKSLKRYEDPSFLDPDSTQLSFNLYESRINDLEEQLKSEKSRRWCNIC